MRRRAAMFMTSTASSAPSWASRRWPATMSAPKHAAQERLQQINSSALRARSRARQILAISRRQPRLGAPGRVGAIKVSSEAGLGSGFVPCLPHMANPAPQRSDRVLTDANRHRPQLSGLDVARAQCARRRGLPVIIGWSHLSDELPPRAPDAGRAGPDAQGVHARGGGGPGAAGAGRLSGIRHAAAACQIGAASAAACTATAAGMLADDAAAVAADMEWSARPAAQCSSNRASGSGAANR